MIADKANDLIELARETLGADFLLPHFVAILHAMTPDMSMLKAKTSALEVLVALVRESESLDGGSESYSQFAEVVKLLGSIVKTHSSQRSVTDPVLEVLRALRDKSMSITFKAIFEEVSHNQFNILK